MTMHLEGPWLSTVGKKRGKVKFRNAEEAKKARELDESWKQLQTKWAVEAEDKKRRRAMSAEPLKYNLGIPEDRSTKHLKSVGQATGVATLAPAKVYTGDKVLGVTVLHKSCLQPVFSKQDAIDAAKMRR